MESAIHQFTEETLEMLNKPDPDWAAVQQKWADIAAASRGTSWESAVDWLGDNLKNRDLEGFRKGVTSLKAASEL